MEDIREKFAATEDMRHQSYVEHALADVRIMVMCAVLCGLDEPGEILLFAQNRATFLNVHFGIKKISSKTTLSRILNMIDGRSSGQSNHRNHAGAQQ